MPSAFVTQCKQIAGSLQTLRPGQVLDENFQVFDKRGVRWTLLCLFAPFFRFFGCDPYSHVRAYQVANRVLLLCQQHREEFLKSPELVERINTEIFSRLRARTKDKYKQEFDSAKEELQALAPKVPEGYLTR